MYPGELLLLDTLLGMCKKLKSTPILLNREGAAGKIMNPPRFFIYFFKYQTQKSEVMDVQIMSGALRVSDKTDAGVRAIYGCRVGQNLPSLEKNTPNKPVIFHQLLVLKGGFIPYLLCPHWHAELDSRVSSLTLGVLSLSRGASPSLSPSQHHHHSSSRGQHSRQVCLQPPIPTHLLSHLLILHINHRPPSSRTAAWEEPTLGKSQESLLKARFLTSWQ